MAQVGRDLEHQINAGDTKFWESTISVEWTHTNYEMMTLTRRQEEVLSLCSKNKLGLSLTLSETEVSYKVQ